MRSTEIINISVTLHSMEIKVLGSLLIVFLMLILLHCCSTRIFPSLGIINCRVRVIQRTAFMTGRKRKSQSWSAEGDPFGMGVYFPLQHMFFNVFVVGIV